MNARLVGIAAALLLGVAMAAPGRAAEPLPKASTPESVGFSSERLKRLDGAMAQAIGSGETQGMITLLARHGKIVDLNMYGERAPGQPMTRDTIFRIYSMTKPVTGVAMMILFEEGKWRLNDPITNYIPEFKELKVLVGTDKNGKPKLEPVKRPPTMRELMTHTAGFSYGFNPTNAADKVFNDEDVLGANGLTQMVQRLAKVPLIAPPGDRWSYSVAVDVQGYIVEKLSGMPFGQFLQQRIFGPLKMEDTGFFVPAGKSSRLAQPYARNASNRAVPVTTDARGLPMPDYTRPPSMESGGGGLVSTIDDYSRFAQMLANKGELDGVRILAPATVELMATNAVPPEVFARNPGPSAFSADVGFGMDVMVIENPRAAGRLEGEDTMSWEGAAGTWFWSDPTNEVVFVGMIQTFPTTLGPGLYDPVTRPLVYQALVDPKK
jgi:CubicO group peptidase (beta-lactamase class C family)